MMPLQYDRHEIYQQVPYQAGSCKTSLGGRHCGNENCMLAVVAASLATWFRSVHSKIGNK